MVVTDALREDQREDLLRRRAATRSQPEHRLIFETDTSAIRRHLDPRWFPVSDDPYRESFSPAFVIGSSMDRELAEAEDFALNQSPYPDPSTLLEDVYAEWIEGKYGLEPIRQNG